MFVGGVPQDLTQDDLYATFSAYATVKKAWLQKCRTNDDNSCPPQNHRGFGFVIFHDPRAIDELLGGSTSRFIGLRNGAKVEVKRAMSSIKISQSKDDGVPAKQVTGPGKPAAKASGQTQRADPSQAHWPMPQSHQPVSHLEVPWMSDADSDNASTVTFGQSTTAHFPGHMPPWYWSPHAHANVGALMTDAFRPQYAAPFDMMPQHVPLPEAWPRRGLLPAGLAGDPEQHDQGHASRVLQNIMHEYDEHTRRTQPLPEKLDHRALDFQTNGLLPAASTQRQLDPIGTGVNGRRRDELPPSNANRQEVLAVASPARPSLNAKPGAPPGLEVESDPVVPWEGHEHGGNVQRYLI